MVVHGTSDYTVYPLNGEQVVASYAKNLDYVVGMHERGEKRGKRVMINRQWPISRIHHQYPHNHH
jgi:hypothetical protein